MIPLPKPPHFNRYAYVGQPPLAVPTSNIRTSLTYWKHKSPKRGAIAFCRNRSNPSPHAPSRGSISADRCQAGFKQPGDALGSPIVALVLLWA